MKFFGSNLLTVKFSYPQDIDDPTKSGKCIIDSSRPHTFLVTEEMIPFLLRLLLEGKITDFSAIPVDDYTLKRSLGIYE